jgi:hypothetical protein
MRRAADGQPGGDGRSQGQRGTPTPSTPNQAGTQEELARALDRLADRLNASDRPQDQESQKLADQASRARDLRERMESLNRQLDALNRQASAAPDARQPGSSAGSAQGRSASPGQGQAGAGGDTAELERLRSEIGRQMQEVRQLLNEAQRDPGTRAAAGGGSTFEGQGMVLSAPGTEGFKQDFARWQELSRQVTLALDDVESSAARKLQEKSARDRLASGADEKVPAEYQQQVDAYFKALATRKRP